MTPATAGSGISGTQMTISSGSPARRPRPEEIKQRLARFLRDELKLELSADKTLITHARTQKARFLGYDIIAQHSATRPAVNGVIGLRVPRDVITARQAPYLVHGTPWYRPGLLNLDDLQIVSTYGQEYRGLVQYYLLAGNVHELDRLHRTAQVSMLKTLACKHRSTVTKMARKYKATIATEHGPRACYEARKERPGRKPLVARFGGIPLKRQRKAVIDDRLPAPPIRRRELVTRLLQRRMRMVRPAGHGGNPPGPQAGRPHLAGAAATRMGGPDGENAAQDAHRLRTLPPGHPRREASRDLHVNIAGEPDALKGARPVRTGGRRKRACTTGTSPAAYRCFFVLEACGLAVQLVNAAQARNLPGRPKTDKLDAQWLARLTEMGLLRAVVRAAEGDPGRCATTPGRGPGWSRSGPGAGSGWKSCWKARWSRCRPWPRKLTTLSAQDMIKAMIAGQRDPQALAGLARGRMKAKHDDLVEALDGMFDDHHGELAQLLLDQIAFLDAPDRPAHRPDPPS